jgi:hypothetical protein
MTVFMSLRVVLVSCQITQNADVDASPGAEVVLGAEPPLGFGLAVAAELPVEVELPVGVELLLGAALPQADSARARAGVSTRAASPSRPVVRDVRFMLLVDGGKAAD